MTEGHRRLTLWLSRDMYAALLRRATEETVSTGRRVSVTALIREALEKAGYGTSDPEAS